MNHPLRRSHRAVPTGLPRHRSALLLLALLALLSAGMILPWGAGNAAGSAALLTPTVTPSSVPSPTPDPAQREAALALAWHGVAHNGDWTPYSEVRDNGIEYVLVPRGCFMMGSTPAQVEAIYQQCIAISGEDVCQREWYTREVPQHRVCIDEPFWISRYEITNAQYQTCVDSFACGASVCAAYEDFGGAQQPAVCVNWIQAGHFAVWSAWSIEHSIRGRLPSEAEWEFAARGPDGLTYPWGEKPPTCALANFLGPDGGCVGATAEVGSTSPQGDSWVGAADMAGNALEWTSTRFAPYPYDPTDGRELLLDPETVARVTRGGTWFGGAIVIRAAGRGNVPPGSALEIHGLRVVIPAEELPSTP